MKQNKRITKRRSAMALLLALIVFALSGCSDTTDQKTDGVPAETTEAATDFGIVNFEL